MAEAVSGTEVQEVGEQHHPPSTSVTMAEAVSGTELEEVGEQHHPPSTSVTMAEAASDTELEQVGEQQQQPSTSVTIAEAVSGTELEEVGELQQQPSTSVTIAETVSGAELEEVAEQVDDDNGTASELPQINSMNAETPPGGWTLNEPSYMARVAGLIEHGLIHFVTKAHVHSFLERLRKAELRRSKQEQDFWTTADP